MTDTTQDTVIETAEQEATNPAPEIVDEKVETADAVEEDSTTSEDPGSDHADEDKPKKKGGFQKKINDLTTKVYEERIRAEAVLRENEELRKRLNPVTSTPTEEPRFEQFNTIEEFVKARDDWAKQQGYRAAIEEQQRTSEQKEILSTQATMRAREDAARTKYTDFDRMINPIAPIIMNDPVLKQFAIESEHAMDVAYHLAKNPSVLHDIAGMTPLAAVRELMKIEDRLKAPPPKTVTNAPPPIKPVGANDGRKKNLAELAESDTAAYVARRNKQELARNKG